MPAKFTTRQAAKKLGISAAALSRYISRKKIPGPAVMEVGGFRVHSWTDEDIERLRKLLPKIANGRKTRHQKKQSAKTKAPAKVPVPHKTRKPKKK
jgi:predicted transcriptional regulator